MSIDTGPVRALTRLALPEDNEYLYRLGVALYGFSSITSLMTEVITYLDPLASRNELQLLTSGDVLDNFRHAAKGWNGPSISKPAKEAAREFEKLNTERSDFVHAYPITGSNGAQILHRRVDSKQKYFEVTSDFLEHFISRLHEVSSSLYEIRGIVRPEL